MPNEEPKITDEMLEQGGIAVDYDAGSYFSAAPIPPADRYRVKVELYDDDGKGITPEYDYDYSGGEESKVDGKWPRKMTTNAQGQQVPVIYLRVAIKCTILDEGPYKGVTFYPRLDGRVSDRGQRRGQSELSSFFWDGWTERYDGEVRFGKALPKNLKLAQAEIRNFLASGPECYARIDWVGEVNYQILKDLDKAKRKQVEAACPKKMVNFPPDPVTGKRLQETQVTVDGTVYDVTARVKLEKVTPLE